MLPEHAIYLDFNAGTPIHPRVRERLRHLLEQDGILGSNSSSTHEFGRRAKRLLTEARDRVALSLGCHPEELVFTSSGTEANQLAIRSVLERLLLSARKTETKAPHWITTAVEHECNLALQKWFVERGGEVSRLPVDRDGCPRAEALEDLLRPETSLVSVIWVNNETGVISPVEKLAEICRSRKVPLHLDGAQAWGKIPFQLRDFEVSFAGFAAHKIGALSGTGVLYVRTGISLQADHPGKQERGRRGGTENLLGIVACGVAAENLNLQATSSGLKEQRDWLLKRIVEQIPGVIINGAGAPRVPNTLNLSFEGIEKDGLVPLLDLAGFAVSSGAACSSGLVEPSAVLIAMGRSEGQARGAVRISLGANLNETSLEAFVQALRKCVQKVRDSSNESA